MGGKRRELRCTGHGFENENAHLYMYMIDAHYDTIYQRMRGEDQAWEDSSLLRHR